MSCTIATSVADISAPKHQVGYVIHPVRNVCLCMAIKRRCLHSRSVPAGVEQCPQCGQSFANAVTLVEHVERNHARKELCVLC